MAKYSRPDEQHLNVSDKVRDNSKVGGVFWLNMTYYNYASDQKDDNMRFCMPKVKIQVINSISVLFTNNILYINFI